MLRRLDDIWHHFKKVSNNSKNYRKCLYCKKNWLYCKKYDSFHLSERPTLIMIQVCVNNKIKNTQ